ncbi:BspA family leucine-rich repeat surface protein [Bifidobacterium sp. ESL0682]|uniref:BspA family leucine-rich repeat surface protein n=1 Tax=Bifidobacterium sp. ESL0682 TaxID=2983212 RepID=UPI0023F81B42|nr:BspA family leucine-rich repeat surface protein [Bifidobacterium sp. ESL0682]WEV41763.1 BspA family leucine-rich repeat surface protein [Bifidobacterium sp. ESL0682]
MQWRVDSACVLHLTGGTTPYWHTYTGAPWYSISRTLAGVSVEGNLTITSPAMFDNCLYVTSFTVQPGAHINLVNQGGVRMFGDTGLTTLDLSNFNTTNATGMSYMFFDCFALATLDLSPLDTTNVTDMSGMFNNTGLATLNLS